MRPFKSNSTLFWACFVFLVYLSVQAHAQNGVVSGKVRDAATSEPLPFTHVFVNQTTVGTVTDEQGNYTLNGVPGGANEIVFSFVGYKPYSAKIQIKDGEGRQLDIRLQVDDTQLETVEVKGTRDKEWEKQLKKFEKVFLGTTKFSGAAKISNPWVLDFKEMDINGKNTFTATASKPLEIENLALGYRVHYYLKSMAFNSDGHNITGEVRFEELATSDAKAIKTWNLNRAEAYYGSLRHLLKSMVAGKAEEEGFNLYIDKSGYENTPYRSAVFSAQLDKSIQSFPAKENVLPGKSENEFMLQMKQRVEVHYTKARSAVKVYSDVNYPVSWLEVNGGVIRTNSNGILLSPSNVIVSGAMYEARVANLLPYNYSPGQLQVAQVIEQKSPLADKLFRLEEKAYVQTDKPYYYPGEKIWFKAYMNYRTPELMDSLSRVLYVELISEERKIIQSKAILIDGGAGEGAFDLPASQQAGNYVLRAYTQWMMNNNHEKFFVKSLPVLGLYERPDNKAMVDTIQQTTSHIKLRTDKLSYRTRERIDLELALRDEAGNPVYADLSVSVTDVKQVVAVPDEKNIMNSFSFSTEVIENAYANEIKFPIEFGISLNGLYKNKKGVAAKASFMMVDLSSNKILPIQTDDKGNFSVSRLQFYDSTEMAFQTPGKKKKFEGTITLQKKETPSVESLNFQKSFPIVKTDIQQRVILPENVSQAPKYAKDKTLPEGVVEPIQMNKENVPQAYAKADFSISGEEIVKSSRTSLINALRGRVPGLTIVNGYLRLGGPSNLLSAATTEPLLIIDGVQITSGATERLNQINPEMVERVDVIKYGGGAMYGSRGSNGVIIVTTKSGDGVTDQSVYELSLVKKVMGYSSPAFFTAPDYGRIQNSSFADTRSTIFWSPQVITDKIGNASVSFYAADIATRYKIVIEGVSATGEPLRGVFFIDVVK